MSIPNVSVVMSVYNGATDLDISVESILTQEGVDLELIVVNDGSVDQSAEILESFARRDPRVQIVNQRNVGLTQSLIRGCMLARGPFIARQDVGDLSLPGRLRAQKDLLSTHENLAFVSCWAEICGPEWEPLYLVKGTGVASRPTNVLPKDRKTSRLLDEPSSHPTVMFRKDVYHRAGGYRPEFYFTQDRELWFRLAEMGQFAMIEQPLYRVKFAPGGISSEFRDQQGRLGKLARSAFLARRSGFSDSELLQQAREIRPSGVKPSTKKANAAWLYFIGENLRKNRDRRAIRYLVQSIKADAFALKPWLRLLQSFVIFMFD